jgi:opacity protein-like surface antigen
MVGGLIGSSTVVKKQFPVGPAERRRRTLLRLDERNHVRTGIHRRSFGPSCRTRVIGVLVQVAVIVAVHLVQATKAAESFPLWAWRFDMGGTIPQDATLTELGGPVTGEKLKLDPGFQLDVGGGYRPTAWLELGPELGFTFNSIHTVGQWSYPDSMLAQMLMMANVRLEYPPQARLAPFIGAGVGGVASFLTFGGGGSGYYDYYYEPDGSGSDFALAFQVFGGLRYRMSEKWSLGLEYRYLVTDKQRWNVDWRCGGSFGISVDSIRVHSLCLVFSGEF